MKRKIIIVDDNPDLIYMVKREMERITDEFEVTGVKSGNECFNLLKKGELPHLILLDIMMPEMSGWDVLAKLREESAWKNIPVLFLTAKDDDTSKGLGTITSNGFITKPFEITDLKEKIDKVLRGEEIV